jgi:hypothetical protein
MALDKMTLGRMTLFLMTTDRMIQAEWQNTKIINKAKNHI